MEEAKRQTRAECMHVLEGFKSVAQGFFHLYTTAAPPRRLWSSYLCSIVRVVGAVSAFFFSHMLQGLCPARAERKGKVVAVDGASIASAHNTVISAGRIVI